MGEGDEIEPPRRPDLYVVARFLDRLRFDEEPHTRSSLQMAVRLNYDLFRSYLAFLEAEGFVRVVPQQTGSDEVHLTEDGQEAHRRIVAWIREVIGDDFL
jgi:predicted transcriptional regulator